MVGDTMSSLGGGDDSDPETVGPSAVYVTQGGQHTIIPPPPLPPHQQVGGGHYHTLSHHHHHHHHLGGPGGVGPGHFNPGQHRHPLHPHLQHTANQNPVDEFDEDSDDVTTTARPAISSYVTPETSAGHLTLGRQNAEPQSPRGNPGGGKSRGHPPTSYSTMPHPRRSQLSSNSNSASTFNTRGQPQTNKGGTRLQH